MRRRKHQTGKRPSPAQPDDPSATAVGICWYAREEYARARELSVDGDEFHETYEQWERNALQLVRKLRGVGVQVCKVPIVLDEVLAWCAERSKPFDSSARSEYAMEWAEQRAADGAD